MQKETSQEKAIPLGNNKHKQSIQIKNSLSLGGEMSQRDREGELTLEYRLPPNLATHPTATAKQEPEMSRPPLGEGGRREPDGRGELAGYLDCPTTNAPTPATAKQEPALKPRLPPNKDTEPSLPSMELRGGGPDRARRGVTPSHNHHSLSR